MRNRSNPTALVCALVLALLPLAAEGQSQSEREKIGAQAELTAAEAALSSAEAAGASTLATTLYSEARTRLDEARANWNSSDRLARYNAGLRAIEAGHAARAAEAQAQLVAANNEIRMLRTEITNLGGSPAAVTLYEPPATISRIGNSMDRVIIAENALKVARGAGADSVAPTILKHADGMLKTARSLARRSRQSDSADHLSYVVEMLARRAEFMARRNAIGHLLPTLRTERAQFTTQAETVARTQIEQDRAARIAAEQNLDMLLRRYESALSEGSRSSAEVEQLRRQVDEQSVALRELQERERATEASRGNEIRSLEQALERERSEGRVTADVLAQREQELRRQREELERLQREREEAERMRREAEQVRTAAIAEAERLRKETEQMRTAATAEAERLRQQTEQQSAELRRQVEAERARATQTEAQLAQARDELARRDAANQQRIATMQAELAKLAETRTSERGFIVTLPGLFFDSGKSALKAGARNTLSKIADQLRVNEDTRIAIEGHTDSVGSDALNQALSEKRAAAVRDYLVNRGVPADRITMSGLGETSPVATNDSPAGRQQNRRVELIIAQQQP